MGSSPTKGSGSRFHLESIARTARTLLQEVALSFSGTLVRETTCVFKILNTLTFDPYFYKGKEIAEAKIVFNQLISVLVRIYK